MKFVNNLKKAYAWDLYEDIFLENLNEIYIDNIYEIYKKDYYINILKKKINIKKMRPGIGTSQKNNSVRRNNNFNLIQQFINLNCKKGKKLTTYKNLNLMFENIFLCLNYEVKEFTKYKDYNDIVYMSNTNFLFSNPNNFLTELVFNLDSIFEIKAKKPKIKSKIKSKSKYSYELIYLPRNKRLRYCIKSLSFYKQCFNNYSLWERFFWSFLLILFNKNNSFLKKRKDYIYQKSIKFFKKKKSVNKWN